MTSGPEVVAFVAEESPDLLIVDMQMGNMGGMAVCLELRLQESYDALDHIPVLMLLDRRPDVFLARRSDAEGWLVKPLDPLRLRRAVAALLDDGTFADDSFTPVPVLVGGGPQLQAGPEPRHLTRRRRVAPITTTVAPLRRRRRARGTGPPGPVARGRGVRAGALHHRGPGRPARHGRARGHDAAGRRHLPHHPGARRGHRPRGADVGAQLLPGRARRPRRPDRHPVRQRHLPHQPPRVADGGSGDEPGDATDPSPLEISRKVRQPYLLPESLGVLEALADMRKHRRAVAVVVDEYGGVAGLLTVKDLLEPLVGDLHDEFDEDEEAHIVRVDNTRWLIDGQTNVDDVRERIGIDIPDGEYVTLGGLLFERFGHIPTEGEEVRVGDWDMRVVEMDKRRVAQVVATFAGGEPGPGATGADDSGLRRPGTPRPTAPGKRPAEAAVVWLVAPPGGRTGCGAAWLARCVRDAEVPGSNPGSPTQKVPGQASGILRGPSPPEWIGAEMARRFSGSSGS